MSTPPKSNVMNWLKLTSLGVTCAIGGIFIYQYTQTFAQSSSIQQQTPVIYDSVVSKEVAKQMMNSLPSKKLEKELDVEPIPYKNAIKQPNAIVTSSPIVNQVIDNQNTVDDKQVQPPNNTIVTLPNKVQNHSKIRIALKPGNVKKPKRAHKPSQILSPPLTKPSLPIKKPNWQTTKPIVITPKQKLPAPTPCNAYVILYEHINFQGKQKKVCANSNYIGDSFNDKASSLKISASVSSVTLYQHADYKGKYISISGGGIEISNVGTRYNDIVSSIKFNKFYSPSSVASVSSQNRSITAYQHINFNGKSKVINQNVSFVGNDFNDIISSFKVGSDAHAVILYQHAEYKGKTLNLTLSGGGGVTVSFVGSKYNDLFSAVKLK